MGTGSFPGVESGQGVTLTPHPLLVPRSKKQGRAIPLLSRRAFVACKRWNLPTTAYKRYTIITRVSLNTTYQALLSSTGTTQKLHRLPWNGGWIPCKGRDLSLSGVPRGVWVPTPHPPKFPSLDKAEPNSQFRGFWRGNLQGKRSLGRPRCWWEDNIKMELQNVGCGGMDWIALAQDTDRWWALVNAVMNLRVP
jgi:hypothetical protein